MFIDWANLARRDHVTRAPSFFPVCEDDLKEKENDKKSWKKRRNVIRLFMEIIVKEKKKKTKHDSTIAGHYLQSASKPNVSSLVVFGKMKLWCESRIADGSYADHARPHSRLANNSVIRARVLVNAILYTLASASASASASAKRETMFLLSGGPSDDRLPHTPCIDDNFRNALGTDATQAQSTTVDLYERFLQSPVEISFTAVAPCRKRDTLRNPLCNRNDTHSLWGLYNIHI